MVADFTGAPMAMDGQIIAYGDIYPNSANTTQRDALISLDPHTGAVNWAAILNYGDMSGISVSASFGVASYLFKVDDTHFCALGGGFFGGGGGLSMWNTDGYFLWIDTTITPGSVYHATVVAPDPDYIITGPRGVGEYTDNLMGWDLSDPDVDRGTGNRALWNYTIQEPGSDPCMCHGDGMVFMGSYSSTSIYAVNLTTGEKVWQTFVKSAIGYMGTYGDGKLFCGSQSMLTHCLNGTTGEIIWINDEGTANRAFDVWNWLYAYGRVYSHDLGFGRTGATKCFDADTGEMLWASQTLFWIGYYRTVIADGKIYGRQSDASVTTGRAAEPTSFACWDAFTGEVLWELRENIAGPIIAYGCLIFVEGAGYGDTGNQLVCMSTAVGKPDNWSMFRGNPDTPGFTTDVGPRNIGSGPKWTFTTGGGIQTTPAVVDGKVYITAGDRYVYCLDAYNGSLIWKYLTNEPLLTHFGSSPAVAGGKVYIGPDDGNFYILNADTGAEIRRIPMGTYRMVQVGAGQHNIRSSPIIKDGRVYVASHNNGRFYCLNLDGGEIWSLQPSGTDEPICGSACIADGYAYIMGYDDGIIYKIDITDGTVALSWEPTRSGDSFWSVFFPPWTFTPTVVGDKLWIGGTNNRLRCWNVTDGTELYAGVQPNVEGENSHGSLVYVPDWAVLSVRGNESVGDTDGKLVTQAGPTMVMAQADTGENIWSNWGGWEVWSNPIYSGMRSSAVIYYGSDSAGLTVVNASNGVALSWYTAQGNIPGSPALWDGKLYCGSYDNVLYCFEDHNTQEMAISISTDKVQMDVGDSITVTMQLTKIPDINVYAELGWPAKTPGLPDTPVLVTFTKPDGVTEVTRSATTDKLGWASVTFAPDEAGTWKIITWYEGEDFATMGYGYAFSDEATVEVTGGAEPTPTPTPTPTTGGEIPMEYVWAAVAVVVIVVVVLVVLLFLRRR
jgi:outer membrane protein assembly factor BamB